MQNRLRHETSLHSYALVFHLIPVGVCFARPSLFCNLLRYLESTRLENPRFQQEEQVLLLILCSVDTAGRAGFLSYTHSFDCPVPTLGPESRFDRALWRERRRRDQFGSVHRRVRQRRLHFELNGHRVS